MHFLLTSLFSRFNSIFLKSAIYKEAALKKQLSEYSLMLFLSNLHCYMCIFSLPLLALSLDQSFDYLQLF